MVRWITCLVLVLGVVACGDGDDQPAEPDAAEPEATAVEESSPEETEESADPSPRPSASSQDQGSAELPQAQELALEDRHPNGTLMRVTGIAFAETSISVDVEVVNGYTEEVQLNSRGMWLADDAGNGYNFVDPEQNSALAVPSGGTLTGTLVFFGVLDGDATSIRLLVNAFNADDTVNLDTRFDRSTDPEFSFDIPLER